MSFYYIYIVKLNNNKFYIGFTDNLKRRINEHITKQVESTRHYIPCALITYIAFQSKKSALKFEKYLKTGSGFAFRNRHLI
jgi:putative endonuclease